MWPIDFCRWRESGAFGLTRFPHITVAGTAFERGELHGTHAAQFVRASIDRYRALYRLCGLSWHEACALALQYRGPIASYRPTLLEELEGIASGARIETEEILALNLRTEIIGSAQVMATPGATPPQECTSLGVTAECAADGHAIIAQNWDYMEGSRESTIVLEVHASESPSFITVVEAGLLAKMGMNAAGIALVTNALATRRDTRPIGVPYHVILRAVLESSSLEDAHTALCPPVRAASGNFMMCDEAGTIIDFETWAGSEACFRLQAIDGMIAHTNHCLLVPEDQPDVPFALAESSSSRLSRAHELLAQATPNTTIDDVESVLSDHDNHPYGICTHINEFDPPLSRAPTSASLVMVPATRAMLLAAGNPCREPYYAIDTSCLARG